MPPDRARGAADKSNAGWMPNAPRDFQSGFDVKFQADFVDDLLSLNGYFSVIGRSVVLHMARVRASAFASLAAVIWQLWRPSPRL